MAAKVKKNNTKADNDTDWDYGDIDIEDNAEESGKQKKGKKDKKDKKEKKEKKEKDPNSPKKGGKGGIIIFVIVFVLIIGLAVAAFAFNVFGLREMGLRGMLEKIPIVNNILPPVDGEEAVVELSYDELKIEADKLQRESDTLKEEIDRLSQLNTTYLEEIALLREFENNQVQFRRDKEEFDREVAFGNNVAYEKYYKQISPENAENIYREVVGIIENEKELKSFVSTYENMDESSAAKIFDQMVRTNLDLVVMILKNISSEQRAAVMASMTTSSAEQVTRRMAPQEE